MAATITVVGWPPVTFLLSAGRTATDSVAAATVSTRFTGQGAEAAVRRGLAVGAGPAETAPEQSDDVDDDG